MYRKRGKLVRKRFDPFSFLLSWFCGFRVDSCTNTSLPRGSSLYIYVYISCVSSSINLNLYFHHLFFCRVVNHEEASQIRSKLRCQINRRLRVSDISGSALFETIPLPWNEEGLSYTFTRRIKTKKSEEYFTSLSIWNIDKPRLFLTRYIYTYM